MRKMQNKKNGETGVEVDFIFGMKARGKEASENMK